jgi:hypothetical protein
VNELIAWAPLISVVLAGIALWRSFSGDRSKELKDKFEAIDLRLDTKASRDQVAILAGKLDIVEDKVTIVENDLKHLPDKDTTHRLEIALGKVESEMGKLSERMKPIANMADRMQEAILEKVMS